MALHDLPSDEIPPELALDGPEPFTLDHLDDVVDLLPEGSPVPEHLCDVLELVDRWTITDDGAAEWAMAHVAAIDANKAALDEQRKAYVERIDRWHRDAVRRLTSRRGYFAGHLERYAAAFRARDPKRNKSLHLPSGTVKSTEAQPKVAVANADRLVQWALDNMTDEDMRAVIKMEPLVSELRKRTVIVVRPIGYEVTLECGHVHHVPIVNAATDAVHTPEHLRADGMLCDQCDPDPISGWLHRTVTAVTDWDERVAVMPSGDTNVDVDGATIDPGGVTFKVVTR